MTPERKNEGKEYKTGHGQISRRPAPWQPNFPHGEARGYQWDCRCRDCREAAARYMADYRKRRKAGTVVQRKRAVGPEHPDFPHGTMRGYRRGCREACCREAQRLDGIAYRANKKKRARKKGRN